VGLVFFRRRDRRRRAKPFRSPHVGRSRL
jgi:hypothetical protein